MRKGNLSGSSARSEQISDTKYPIPHVFLREDCAPDLEAPSPTRSRARVGSGYHVSGDLIGDLRQHQRDKSRLRGRGDHRKASVEGKGSCVLCCVAAGEVGVAHATTASWIRELKRVLSRADKTGDSTSLGESEEEEEEAGAVWTGRRKRRRCRAPSFTTTTTHDIHEELEASSSGLNRSPRLTLLDIHLHLHNDRHHQHGQHDSPLLRQRAVLDLDNLHRPSGI